METSPDFATLAVNFVQRNASAITALGKNLLKTASDTAKFRMPKKTYKAYLSAAGTKYGRSKSFFVRSEPISIYEFYIPLGVSLGQEKLHQVTYNDVMGLTRVRTHYSHQMTAAARAIAAMKFLMLRSKRVAIRRQSLRRQNMRSMMLRCL